MSSNIVMKYEETKEIERLAAEAFDKQMIYECLCMMNIPSDYDERKQAAIGLAIARRAMIKSKLALDAALNA